MAMSLLSGLVGIIGIIIIRFPTLEAMVVAPTPESTERKTILFTGWQYQQKPPLSHFPRTDNYYFRIKPESVVEILVDTTEEDDNPLGSTMAEHTSITTSVGNNAEYKNSCSKEPGCRWECEPRQDEFPPDCDCVCFYTDAKWDHMP